jgi:hypothetical protein
MTFAEWRFSAQLAWQDSFIRWTTVVSLLAVFSASGFALMKLIPEGTRSGVLTMHYTIYLGIDDVRPWPWVFAIPGAFVTMLLANTGLSFGLFRTDVIAARALTGLAAAISIIAGVSVFFLVLINL